ncbi:MAG: hypothetical protein AAB693_02180 [Patescibacteria group bacterium]
MKEEIKTCQNCQKEFPIEPEDFLFYQKIKVPPPIWCPECRMVRRMIWRNERSLYQRKCDLCEKLIITVYKKESPFVVYCRNCWFSDKWDANTYSLEYLWDKNFFLQFMELIKKTPLMALDCKGTMVNSEYCNYGGNCKNCYLCFATALSEDSLYCSYSQDLKQCMDSTRLLGGELCYEANDSEKNYSCAFIKKTKGSLSSYFLFGCSTMTHCFMNANLRNKNYVLRGQVLSPEDYYLAIKEVDLGSFKQIQNLKEEFTKLKVSALHKYAEIKNSVNAIGNNITNSKNVQYSFDIFDSENIKYSFRVLKGCRDIYDCHGMISGQLVYEGFGCGISPYNNLFSFSIDVSRNLKYCVMCINCTDCFACVGLRNKSYCILNKQYTKEEYEELVPKIIQHMNDMPYVDKKGRIYEYGEFFPPELSPFSYNETIAQEYFPLTKEEAINQGYSWKEEEIRNYEITLKTEDIPDNIKDVTDDILNQVIQCQHYNSTPPPNPLPEGEGENKKVLSFGEDLGGAKNCNEQCTTAFKIIPRELDFYRRMNLPLPRLCPNCRHYQRLKQRNPLKLWERQCQCNGGTSSNNIYTNTVTHFHNLNNPEQACRNTFQTSYSPERPEIVYCEKCYQQEIY